MPPSNIGRSKSDYDISCPRCVNYARFTPSLTCCWCNSARLIPSASTNNALPIWDRGECHCDTCNNLRHERLLAGLPAMEQPVTPEHRVNAAGEFQILNGKGWWKTIDRKQVA